MNKYILNYSEGYYKELALVTAVILHEDLLGGTIWQTFDDIYDNIAPKFIEKYPLGTSWGENDNEFDETIIEFVKEYIKK